MVKILANGEIVPDDDPRARASTNNSNSRQRNTNSQRGGIPPPGPNQYEGGQPISLFQTVNQRLSGYGIPRFNIGDTVIEPIVSVGLTLAVVLFGVQGLLFGLLLFAVSHWSNNGPPDFVGRFLGTQQQQQPDPNRRGGNSGGRGGGAGGGGGGGGHRLGRN